MNTIDIINLWSIVYNANSKLITIMSIESYHYTCPSGLRLISKYWLDSWWAHGWMDHGYGHSLSSIAYYSILNLF